MNQLSTSTNPIPPSWVDALFAKMLSLYGNKFSDMWRDQDISVIKKVWAEELGKLSRDDMARGAKMLMQKEWPPTLPEFIKMCKPVIDPLSAYYEAVNGVAARARGERGEWSHPAVFWASVKVGAFDLKNSSYSAIKGRWEASLAEELAKERWNEIPDAAIALPAPSQKAEKAVADKYFAETQVIKHETQQVDHKRWAKKIMERYRNGDKTLLHIQIQFAKEALENEVH